MALKFMVLDFETSISQGPHGGEAKDPSNDFYTVIWGNKPDNIVIEHKEGGYSRTLPQNAVAMLNCTDVLIGHNIGFDLSYIWHTEELRNFLLRGGQIWDTQVAEYLMSGQRHAMASLAELQLLYLGQKIKEDLISSIFSKKVGANVIIKSRMLAPDLWETYESYCKGDGESTFKIFIKQYEKVKSMNMLNVVKLYNRYLLSLLMIQNTGLNIDRKKCEHTLRRFRLEANKELAKASSIIEPMWDSRLGEFNINSPKDKSAILFGGTYVIQEKELVGKFKNGNDKYKLVDKEIHIKGFGLPLDLTSPSEIAGRYKTDVKVVTKIAEQSTNAKAKEYCILQRLAMNYQKMCSTYLEPFLNLSVNGKLYPRYNNTITVTGRLSSSSPNLQNVPSKGEMGEAIQEILCAPEGWVCVSADYAQLEIYVLAYLSQDPVLLKDLLDGIDFHIKRLAYAEDMEYNEVYKKCKIEKLPEWELKRSNAKTISYQKAYGAAPKSLARTTGLPEEVIRKIFEREDIEYQGVTDFNATVLEEVNKNKKISQEAHLPRYKKLGGKHGKRFVAGCELLPIFDKDGNVVYDENQLRHLGYYKCVTGKRYAFEEVGRLTYHGLKRGFSHTETKNYQIQGTAGDVQAASSANLLGLLLKHADKVKMVNEIHDSKWFIVKESHLNEIIKIIKDKMEDVPGNFKKYLDVDMPFKIPVDFKIGKDFGKMESYKLSGELNDRATQIISKS